MMRLLVLPMVFMLLMQSRQRRHAAPTSILIMTDDQGYGDMSCHGNPYLQDAQPRPPVSRERAADGFPRRPDLFAHASCVDDGPILVAGGRLADLWRTASSASRRGHDGRRVLVGRLSHGHLRQVASGRQLSLSAAGPRIPRVASSTAAAWSAKRRTIGATITTTIRISATASRKRPKATARTSGSTRRFVSSSRTATSPSSSICRRTPRTARYNVPWKYAEPFVGPPEDPRTGGPVLRHDGQHRREHRPAPAATRGTGTGRRHAAHLPDRQRRNRRACGCTTRGCGPAKGPPTTADIARLVFSTGPAGGLTGGMTSSRSRRTSTCSRRWSISAGCDRPQTSASMGRTSPPYSAATTTTWPERTLFVHHQGRFGQKIQDDRPIKYKDFAVMTNRWRLVGKELYEIQADPGQRNDVAAEAPGNGRPAERRLRRLVDGYLHAI